eukprot:349589-Chlamydomonas_euryale.AAC.2
MARRPFSTHTCPARQAMLFRVTHGILRAPPSSASAPALYSRPRVSRQHERAGAVPLPERLTASRARRCGAAVRASHGSTSVPALCPRPSVSRHPARAGAV